MEVKMERHTKEKIDVNKTRDSKIWETLFPFFETIVGGDSRFGKARSIDPERATAYFCKSCGNETILQPIRGRRGLLGHVTGFKSMTGVIALQQGRIPSSEVRERIAHFGGELGPEEARIDALLQSPSQHIDVHMITLFKTAWAGLKLKKLASGVAFSNEAEADRTEDIAEQLKESLSANIAGTKKLKQEKIIEGIFPFLQEFVGTETTQFGLNAVVGRANASVLRQKNSETVIMPIVNTKWLTGSWPRFWGVIELTQVVTPASELSKVFDGFEPGHHDELKQSISEFGVEPDSSDLIQINMVKLLKSSMGPLKYSFVAGGIVVTPCDPEGKDVNKTGQKPSSEEPEASRTGAIVEALKAALQGGPGLGGS